MSDAYALLVGSRPTPAPASRPDLTIAREKLQLWIDSSMHCAARDPDLAKYHHEAAASYRAALAILDAAQ